MVVPDKAKRGRKRGKKSKKTKKIRSGVINVQAGDDKRKPLKDMEMNFSNSRQDLTFSPSTAASSKSAKDTYSLSEGVRAVPAPNVESEDEAKSYYSKNVGMAFCNKNIHCKKSLEDSDAKINSLDLLWQEKLAFKAAKDPSMTFVVQHLPDNKVCKPGISTSTTVPKNYAVSQTKGGRNISTYNDQGLNKVASRFGDSYVTEYNSACLSLERNNIKLREQYGTDLIELLHHGYCFSSREELYLSLPMEE